jgi:uncharacterized damage-inducible protein DinB
MGFIQTSIECMARTLVDNFIRQIHELHTGSLWFDQCFQDRLTGLSETDAFVRPLGQIHSVAEHISHILAWRRECLLRFRGERTDLMNSPEDWRSMEELRTIGWTRLTSELEESKMQLINALTDQNDDFLQTPFLDTGYNFLYLMEGIIHHDVYHLGQIGITIKLLKDAKFMREHRSG